MNDRCKRCDAPAVWHGKVYDNKFFEDVSYPLCEKCKAELDKIREETGGTAFWANVLIDNWLSLWGRRR